jgi:peptide/nickel transport system substrate-binding protein
LTLALVACVTLGLAGCSDGGSPQGTAARKGVKGGTLRIANVADLDSLDPAVAASPASWALMRLYARTLYSWDSSAVGDDAAAPVPDLAARPPSVSADQRTWTFTLRRGVSYAPPVDRPVEADDFVYAVERQIKGRSPVNPYVWMIKGTREFAAGKAKSISGLQAPDGWTVRITLVRPEPDLPSILALPWFALVPRAYAAKSSVGEGYARRIVGSGPYTLDSWAPGKSIILVRNRNWDPSTDPLRKAWVDKVEVRSGQDPVAIQRAIEEHGADLTGDGVPPPNADLQRLATDPRLATQFGVKSTGCLRYLVLQANAGPTAQVKVRQAIEYAVDKQAVLDALGGRFAGDTASTVLPPSVAGHSRTELYPSVAARGDVDKAKQLLREAGFPNGVTLTYAGESTGQGPALTNAVRTSLARAGIKLTVRAWPGRERYEKSLRVPAERERHHVGAAEVCADWPGDSARSIIAARLDGRAGRNNTGGYNSPEVNRLVDQALGETDPERRAELWSEADQRVMADAAWVPLFYERRTFFWSYRVKNWTYSPWVSLPDYANLWLDPYTP